MLVVVDYRVYSITALGYFEVSEQLHLVWLVYLKIEVRLRVSQIPCDIFSTSMLPKVERGRDRCGMLLLLSQLKSQLGD